MIVLFIILVSTFIYLLVGRVLVRKYKYQITKNNTSFGTYYDHQDEIHYIGRTVNSDNYRSMLMMQFLWPIYYWVMKAYQTQDEVELEVDDGERTKYVKYLEDTQQRLSRLQERQEKIELERIQKLAELEKSNPLTLEQVVYPKGLRPYRIDPSRRDYR